MTNRIALVTLLCSTTALTAGCGTEDADQQVVFGEVGFENAELSEAFVHPSAMEFAPQRIIVGLDDDDVPSVIDVMDNKNQMRSARLIRTMTELSSAVYEVEPDVDILSAVEELRASGRYSFVEPDYVRKVASADAFRSYQWHLDTLGAEDAWVHTTGAGVVVAVIDTGVSSGPYDGMGLMVDGYDFVNDDEDAADDHGHGTHVAGSIAQATNNSEGVAGLAPDAAVMPIKVLGADGSGYSSHVALGIYYAVDHGAHVINLSLGSASGSSLEQAAIDYAHQHGVFVAAASGNDGINEINYPAAYQGAVAVGATDYANDRAYYSNGGPGLALMAPGGDVTADLNGDGHGDGILQETHQNGTWGYYFFAGTSMASPQVAATAAMLMSLGATSDEAKSLMLGTAIDLDNDGWDENHGHGMIQPLMAIETFLNSDAPDIDDDPCELTIRRAVYSPDRGLLKVKAVSDDPGTIVELHADGHYIDTLHYHQAKNAYVGRFPLENIPAEVEVLADCGGSDSHTVRIR